MDRRPYLILDAYLDDLGGARNLVPRLEGAPHRIVRVARGEAVPDSAEPFTGILVTGSAASLLDPPPWVDAATGLVRDALRRSTPYLGLCFGHQLLAHAAGGEGAVVRSTPAEFGWVEIEQASPHPLLAGLPERFLAFESHRDEVRGEVPGLVNFARSADCAVQAIQVPGERQFGVQFHPEMSLEEIRALIAERLEPESASALLGRAVDTADLGDHVLARFLRG